MVDSIDKSLPNTVEEIKDEEFQEKEVPVPGGEEVITTDTSEVVMDEEGGAEVTFDPTTVPGRQSDGHFSEIINAISEELTKESYLVPYHTKIWFANFMEE